MVSCSLKDPLNFLYDYEANPFRRDSLGHLNGMPESGFNQWGLLYPNAFGLYPNRRKKLEKQPSNERAQKDSLNKVPTKKELLDWYQFLISFSHHDHRNFINQAEKYVLATEISSLLHRRLLLSHHLAFYVQKVD